MLLIGEVASGYTMGQLCNNYDWEINQRIFGAVGIAKEIKEILLNAVTGLRGSSGPAYIYQFIEALADGGVQSGLPRDVSMELAAQTVKEDADMVLKTGKYPGKLQDNVTSPGGTTNYCWSGSFGKGKISRSYYFNCHCCYKTVDAA